MTYYKRVKQFRDNQQRLLDEFLAEVVSHKLLTKTSEVNDENVNKVFLHLRSKNFNRKTVSTWSEHIDKLQQQKTNKEINEELILEYQFCMRFWDIYKPLLQANNKLERIKYFASK